MSNNRIILVLGSGATVGSGFTTTYNGTDWVPPMDFNFFETPIVRTQFLKETYPALSWYQSDPSLETTWSKIDLYLKLCLGKVISEENTWRRCEESMNNYADTDISYKAKMDKEPCYSRFPSMAGWEFRCLVRNIYRSIKLPSHNKNPLEIIIREIYNNKLLNGIITFNYETSLEQVIKNNFNGQFYYALPNDNETSNDNKIPLYKLHGSLNWKQNNNGIYPDNISELAIPEMSYNSSNGNWEQPAIIGPTIFKQEINIDFQNDPASIFYKNLWHMCWRQLKTIEGLVFIGFAFPDTDFHVRILFESIHKVKPFKKIVLCTKNDEKIEEKAQKIFCGANIIHFKEGFDNLSTRVGEVIDFLKHPTDNS